MQDLAHAAEAKRLGLQPRASALHHHIVGLADALEDHVVAQMPMQHPLHMLMDQFAAHAPARPEALGDALQADDVHQSRGKGGRVSEPIQHLRQIGRVQLEDRRGGGRMRAPGLRVPMKRFGHPRY